MALDKGESSATNVTDIANARKGRQDMSSIAYGRRASDDPGGPNLQAQVEALKSRPNVRPVREGRTAGRRFDKEKVDAIKAQLARGDYEIDALKVADLFIEHERHC